MTTQAARVKLTSNLTGLTSPYDPVTWHAADFDTASFWSAGAPTRLTVPSGMSYARVTCALRFPDNTGTGTAAPGVLKNGSPTAYYGRHLMRQGSVANCPLNSEWVMSQIVPVTAGDYFTAFVSWAGLGSPTSILADLATYFGIESVG